MNIKYLLIRVSHSQAVVAFPQIHFLRVLLEVLQPHDNNQDSVFFEIGPIQRVQRVIRWLGMQRHSVSVQGRPVRGSGSPSPRFHISDDSLSHHHLSKKIPLPEVMASKRENDSGKNEYKGYYCSWEAKNSRMHSLGCLEMIFRIKPHHRNLNAVTVLSN